MAIQYSLNWGMLYGRGIPYGLFNLSQGISYGWEFRMTIRYSLTQGILYGKGIPYGQGIPYDQGIPYGR